MIFLTCSWLNDGSGSPMKNQKKNWKIYTWIVFKEKRCFVCIVIRFACIYCYAWPNNNDGFQFVQPFVQIWIDSWFPYLLPPTTIKFSVYLRCAQFIQLFKMLDACFDICVIFSLAGIIPTSWYISIRKYFQFLSNQ